VQALAGIMLTIFKIISKNFKLLTRSKASSLIVIFGPLLLIFLVGVAFDTTNTYNINIGVYSQQFNNVTESFVNKLNQNNFKVHKYDSEDKCIEHIRTGRVHTCVVFPPNMEFRTGVTNEIVFHIDYTKINLVWIILDTISTQLSATESEVSEELANIILSRLYGAQQKLNDKKAALSDLKAKTSEIKLTISKIKDDLDKLDFSADRQEFKVDELKQGNNNIQTAVNSLKNDTDTRIADIKTNLQNVKSKINDLNLTEQATKVGLIEGDVNGIRYKLNTTINSTETDLQNMSESLFFLENSVNKVISNLQSAANTRTTSSVSIQNMNSVLDGALNALNSIEQTFNDIDTSIASIKVTTAQDIINPITTTIKPITQESTQLNYLFPSLMVLVIMFISILLSTTIIMMEKHSPAHFRNFIAPIGDLTFVLGTYLTSIVLVTAQLVIILFVSSIFFKTQIISNLLPISGLLLVITSLFTLLGMIIGYLFDSEETATLAAISVGTILMLLSSTILPLETMPEYFSNIAEYNPFVVSTDMLRKAILFEPSLETFKEGAILLFSYLLVLFLFTWLLQKNYKRNYLHKLVMLEKRFLRKRKKK
jgi:ABC-type multidrug transport system permease subunit